MNPRSEVPQQQGRLFYGYIIVLAAFIVVVFTFGTVHSFGIFLKPMVADTGWSVAATSGAYSMGMLMRGFLSILTGKLSDRFGPRIVVSACALFLGLGHILMSQIGPAWQLYLYYGFVVALGQSASWVPISSTVSRWFVKRRGMMVGIVLAGSGVGTMFIPPLSRWLLASYDWRTSFAIVGAVSSVVMVLAAQFLKRDPGKMGLSAYGEGEIEINRRNLDAEGFSLGQAMRTRQFWMLAVAFLSADYGAQTVMVHIVPHATELGIIAASAVALMTAIGALTIVGRIGGGSVADRIGNRSAMAIGLTLASVSLFWLVPAGQLWMLYLFAIAFGLGFGIFPTMLPTILAQLFGQASMGVIVGSINFASNIGATLGPVMSGALFDIYGSYKVAFLIAAVLGVLSVTLTLMVRPVQEKTGLVRTAPPSSG